MNCKELYEDNKRIMAERRELNARKIIAENTLNEKWGADEVAAWLKSEHNMPDILVNALLHGDPTPEGKIKQAEAMSKPGRDAMTAMQEANEILKTQGKEALWEKSKTTLKDWIKKSLNTRPKGADVGLDAFMHGWHGLLGAMGVGKTKGGREVFVGTSVGTELKRDFNNLMASDNIKATRLNRQQVDDALHFIGHARSGDISSKLGGYVKRLEAAVQANPENQALKAGLEYTNNAKRIYDASPEARQYMAKYFENLDVESVALRKAEVLEKGEVRNNYYHNTVSVLNKMDPMERTLEGSKYSTSNFQEAKSYDNGIEYLLDKGKMPGDPSFLDNASFYQAKLANVLRRRNAAKEMRAQGMNDNPNSQWTITTNGYAERALVTKTGNAAEWEIPKTKDGRAYKHMDAVSDAMIGVYAHPDLFKWAEQAMTGPQHMEGFTGGYMRANNFWKNNILGFGAATFGLKGVAGGALSVHGASLTLKGATLARAAGIEGWWKPWSVVGKGLQMIADHSERYLDALQHGLVTNQHDAEGLLRGVGDYNVNTGKDRAWGKFKDWMGNQHDVLFGQYQPGIKVGMLDKLMDSDWFKKMESDKGHDYAMNSVCKALNDHFGGQNLELVGRKKIMQTFLQATLLAPDWQNSKINRMAGMVTADQPEVRKLYQRSVANQMIFMVATHYAISKLAQNLWGAPAQDEEAIARDMLMGNLGFPIVHRTEDGKDVRARLNVAFTEDTRPVLKLAAAIHDAYTGKTLEGEVAPGAKTDSYAEKLFLPVISDVYQELSNKASPMLKIPGAAYERWRTLQTERPNKKGEFKQAEATPFDLSALPLPIPVSQVYYALRGGYAKDPQERAAWALLSAGLSTAGVPIQTTKGKAYADQKAAEAKRGHKTAMKLKKEE